MTYSETHSVDATVRKFIGVKIAASTPLYFTDAPFTVSYGGASYIPDYSIALSELVQGDEGVGGVTITIGNADAMICGVLVGLSGRYRYPDVSVYEWWFDATTTDTTIQDTRILFPSARLETSEWDGNVATLSITPGSNALAASLPVNQYSGSTCIWARDFKGQGCGATTNAYTSCSGSFVDCTARSNTSRFSAYRHTPRDGQTFYYGTTGSFIVGPAPDFDPNQGL